MKCVGCGKDTDGKKWGSPYWCALCGHRAERGLMGGSIFWGGLGEEDNTGGEDKEVGGRLGRKGKGQHI